MKLHEKILTHYLSCTSPVDKEGYLYKKKERNASYQRRWFVLKANLLFYQERPADRHLLGVIVLEGCAVRRSESDGQFALSLAFEGTGLKTYRFAAVDRQTQESWVKALLSASHCYLSLLVRDLERQYDEAKQQQSSAGSHHRSSVGALKQSPPTSVFLPAPGPAAAVRETRSFSASAVLQAPSTATRVAAKKSPKLWPRRNALVTPLNGPAPSYGEWPLVGFDPLEEFSKLHDYYGQEVRKAREDWLSGRRAREEGDLIDLGVSEAQTPADHLRFT
ncbi:putative sesquipedalian-1-like [Scophthalmus maximus]|uniref:Sesquipedalian n=1 Tax=Scophthalmus maximus TaxID=52904 RepID=A0A2U9CTI9_SCOMX|nr:putative sesquipedalian-1-like [Scophthalmus maximus]